MRRGLPFFGWDACLSAEGKGPDMDFGLDPLDATDSDRLPDGLAGTWERRTPDGRMEATIADGAIEVVRVSGDSREVRWKGVYEARGREWVVREAPKESHTADNGVWDFTTDSIIFSAIL